VDKKKLAKNPLPAQQNHAQIGWLERSCGRNLTDEEMGELHAGMGSEGVSSFG
jgi:hypothetical protein